jgi:peptidyl-tRNA hydrolase, PTH1 family
MYLIVGLGNPGQRYEDTRHNIGFKVIDRLARDLSVDISKNHCQAVIGQTIYEGHKLILAKPQTFMNLSGNSVAELVQWYKIDKKHIIVIHDDLDIDSGRLKIKEKGNSAGHNGVESIIQKLASPDFIRIRIGIGRRSLGEDNASYVLEEFHPAEHAVIAGTIAASADAVLKIVKGGVEAAMNEFNIS